MDHDYSSEAYLTVSFIVTITVVGSIALCIACGVCGFCYTIISHDPLDAPSGNRNVAAISRSGAHASGDTTPSVIFNKTDASVQILSNNNPQLNK